MNHADASSYEKDINFTQGYDSLETLEKIHKTIKTRNTTNISKHIPS